MKFGESGSGQARAEVEAVAILGDHVFEDVEAVELREGHVSEGGLCLT